MNLLRWLGVFSAAVLATVLVSSGAHAAEKRGLTLSPVRSEVVLAAAAAAVMFQALAVGMLEVARLL